MRYAKFTMESNRFGDTIKAFDQYGIQANPSNYPIYKTLILEIFQDCDGQEVAQLRNVLYKLIQQLEQKNEIMTPAGKEFKKYLMIAHLVNQSNIYQKKNVANLFA